MVSRDDVVDTYREAERRLRSLFKGELRLTRAYRGLFIKNGELTRDGEIVMKDLMRFARVDQDTGFLAKNGVGGVDPYLAGMIEGRRQVVSRIGRALWMPASEFQELKHGAYDGGRTDDL